MSLPVHWRESRAQQAGRHLRLAERGMHWQLGCRSTAELPACPGSLGSTGCPQPPSHRRIYYTHRVQQKQQWQCTWWHRTDRLPAWPGILGSTRCPQRPSRRRICYTHRVQQKQQWQCTWWHRTDRLPACPGSPGSTRCPQPPSRIYYTHRVQRKQVIMYKEAQNWWAPCMPWITGIHRMPTTTITQTNILHTQGGTETTVTMYTVAQNWQQPCTQNALIAFVCKQVPNADRSVQSVI